MYFEDVDFSDVGTEYYKKCPIVEGLEAYKEEIQTKGMSKEVYRQVEQIAPGVLNTVDPMRLSVTPSWIMQNVAVEALGRTIGRYSLIAVIGAVIVKLISWIYNKFKKKKGDGGGSADIGSSIAKASKELKEVDPEKIKHDEEKVSVLAGKVISESEKADISKGIVEDMLDSCDFSPEFKAVCKKALAKAHEEAKEKEIAGPPKPEDFHRLLLIEAYNKNCKNEPKYAEGLKILERTNKEPKVLITVYLNTMKSGVSEFDTHNYQKLADKVLSAATTGLVTQRIGEYTKVLTSIPDSKASGANWVRRMRAELKAVNTVLDSGYKSLEATKNGTGYDLNKFQEIYNKYASGLNEVIPFSEALVKCGSLDKLESLISKTAYTASFKLFDTSDKCMKFFSEMYKSTEGSDENSPEQIEASLEKLKAAGVSIDQDLANEIKATSMNVVQFLNATRQLAKLHYRVLKVSSRCWRV